MSRIMVDIDQLVRDSQSVSEHLTRIRNLRQDEPKELKEQGDNVESGIEEYSRCIRFAADNYKRMRSEVRDVISSISI
ncbi:hypothetical protein [Butyrivibrio fibrisolvens]|uniref:Uncharacterized protein n=1 Tax=Butyrivibrio fibrisolvens TaxID=831 RepID=A0A317G5F7_BUTFI|nr:hypothetical protein [Butyrivibrio fibrisolvens]PWT28639.1 hypothetical protein CPT75_16735 [Butyrivibrio fibrisolvens]